MKVFRDDRSDKVLLIEAKNNEMFLRQADCCISIQGTYYGKILYYE